jgi:hypothetical protein
VLKKSLLLLSTLSFCASALAATPIYSPYKDTSINLNWNSFVISSTINGQARPLLNEDGTTLLQPGNDTITLAFATGTCGTENWGGVAADSLANANLPLIKKSGLNYIISTGGAAGAFTCNSKTGMQTFLNRYDYTSDHFAGLDFDIEGGYNEEQIKNLMTVTAQLQKEHHFRVSLTLATLATSGGSLNILGIWAVNAANAAGLDYNVNLMVMDFGGSGCQSKADGSCDMAASAKFAAQTVSDMYNIPLNRIELTPMIGDNDVRDEVTTIADMSSIANYVKNNGLAGLHYWSFDRDTPCTPKTNWASPTCNNESTEPQSFNKAALAVLAS